MELSVLNSSGQSTGKVATLHDHIFAIEPNDHAIYLDVKLIMANRRQGTHKTKERGEVSGTTKKPYRQKGTGGARAGHMRSPLMRHGGTIFGPKPRDYSFKLNKKLRVLARCSALAYKVREQNLLVVEDFTFNAPETKAFKTILNNLSLQNTKTLVVLSSYDKPVYYSARNITGIHVVHAAQLNTYDIVNAEKVLLFHNGLEVIHNNLSR